MSGDDRGYRRRSVGYALEHCPFAAEVSGQVVANFDGALVPCRCPRHVFVGVDCLSVERRDGQVRCLQCGDWSEVEA